MVKKKESLPIEKADLHNERWINTPFAYTKFGADFSLLQQDIMLKVSDHLQDYISQFFEEKRNEGDLVPKSLFSEYLLQEGIPPIRINLSDLSIGKSNYGLIYGKEDENGMTVLKGAIESIRTLGIRRKYIDEKTGKHRVKLINIFSSVDIPNFSHVDKDTGETVESRYRAGYIDLKINTEVAAHVFDMSKGYVNHIKQIASYSTKRSAPRVYLLLMHYYGLGNRRVKIPLMELKEYTGNVIRNEEGEIIQVQYPKFSQYKQRVLDPAKEDVDKMAYENKSDITFTYRPIYRGTKQRGDPESVEFVIELSRLGEQRDSIRHRQSAENKLIGKMIKDYQGIDGTKLRRLVMSIQPDEAFAEFKEYAYNDLPRIVEKKAFDMPDEQAAYVLTLVQNWIDLKRNDLTKKQPVQQELFDEGEIVAEPVADTLEPGAGMERWLQLLSEYDGPAKSALHEVKYLGLDNGVFCIVATAEQREVINTLGDGELYRHARLILGMSETSFRPPIVMRKE